MNLYTSYQVKFKYETNWNNPCTLPLNLHLNPIYPWQPFKFNSRSNPFANRQTKVATSFNDSPHHLGPDKAPHLMPARSPSLVPAPAPDSSPAPSPSPPPTAVAAPRQPSKSGDAFGTANSAQHTTHYGAQREGRGWAGFASWEIEYFTCLFEFYKHWRQQQQTEKEVYQAKKEEENE